MQTTTQRLVATVDPVTVTSAAAKTSDAIDLSLYHDVTFYVSMGDMANEIITITLQRDADSAFSDPTTHGSADAVAASAAANDNTQRVYHVEAREVSERYLRVHLVTGNITGGIMSVVALATPRFSEVADLATVTRV